MAMFPDVQKKAQVELDRVVGPGRLPDFEDMDALPYIRAVMMETTRWIPVVPFGVPHRLAISRVLLLSFMASLANYPSCMIM